MRRAVVVGAGPNGLAAAVRLAEAGWKVVVFEAADTPGGGSRTKELTLPGFRHDVCSAIHPLAAASPYFSQLPLEKYGLEWVESPAPLAHPLLDGRVGVLERSLDVTARWLEQDGAAWIRAFRPFVERFTELTHSVLRPVVQVPRHPMLLAHFGLQALRSGTGFAEAHFQGELARALFAGCAAHSIGDLDAPFTAAAGLLLASAGHAVGWPFAKGGSQAIIDALVRHLQSMGGEVVTSHRVRAHSDLPPHDAALYDTDAWQMVRICGDALPSRYARAVQRFEHGPAVFKIDYALDGPIPWKAPACARAATVHLGGTLQELREGEKDVAQGRIAERPYVLVAQHTLFDPSRAPPGKHTAWAYCHIPFDSTVDATAQLEGQLERFAPGFRDRVLSRSILRPRDFSAYNANYEGGDISAGAMAGLQNLARPVKRAVPYATPNPRIFLCSASTPPGPGVHGLCGYFAAQAVLSGIQPEK